MIGNHSLTGLMATVQRGTTGETDFDRLESRAPAIAALGRENNEFVLSWDDIRQRSNCHGYTVTGGPGAWVESSELLPSLDQNRSSDGVVVFVSDGEIGHSGRLSGNVLTHLLRDVGIVRSRISATERLGHDQRFDLDAGRSDLDTFQHQRGAANAKLSELNRWVPRIAAVSPRSGWSADRIADLANDLETHACDFSEAMETKGEQEREKLMAEVITRSATDLTSASQLWDSLNDDERAEILGRLTD